MAKVTITFTDKNDTVEINITPPLSDINQTQSVTLAELFAMWAVEGAVKKHKQFQNIEDEEDEEEF